MAEVNGSSSGKGASSQKRGPSIHQIYSRPAPLRTFPLPTFYPDNPLSLFHVASAWLSQLFSPPPAEPAVVHHGLWSEVTTSVHVKDEKSMRALWEQGFYGKGNLSRSEPNWLKRERVRKGLQDVHVSELLTMQRRQERAQAKWERARLEQEAIHKTRLEEARQDAARRAGSEGSSPMAPVGPLQLLALPNSHVDMLPSDEVEIVPEMVANGKGFEEDSTSVKPQKSVRFSPRVQSTTFQLSDPPSPNQSPAAGCLSPVQATAPTMGGEELINREHLQLTPEEAFFLCFGLGALVISEPESKEALSTRQLLTRFRQYSYCPPRIGPGAPDLEADDGFLLHYVVYHHFRSLGWVPRAGIKFGVDWLLYARGPVFDHAEFGVIIVPSYSDVWWNKSDTEKSWAWLHGVVRVLSHVMKSLVLVYVEVPATPRLEEALKAGIGEALALYKRFRYRLPAFTVDGELEPGGPVAPVKDGGDKDDDASAMIKEQGHQSEPPLPLKSEETRAVVKELRKELDNGASLIRETLDLFPSMRENKSLAGAFIDTRLVLTVAWASKVIFVEDEEREFVRLFHVTNLRDNCTCPSCYDISSGNKLLNSFDIPDEICIESVRATDEGLWLTLVNDTVDHGETMVPWDVIEVGLRRRGSREGGFPRRQAMLSHTGMVCWDRQVLEEEVRSVAFNDYMTDDEAFWDAIIDLLRLGIVFIRGVPLELDAVEEVTTRIAGIQETFYGRIFDVRADGGGDTARNVAYSARALPLHQDLQYLDHTPMIQVLHCLENSCDGGDSLFSDAERIARLLWPYINVSERLLPLVSCTVDCRYRGQDNRRPAPHPHHFYQRARRVLHSSGPEESLTVSWSPPFQAPVAIDNRGFEKWLNAARFFDRLVSDPKAVYRVRLQPGDCVIFDNRRLLHGRTAFDPSSGSRWMRGAYISSDDFLSRASQMPLAQAHHYRGEDGWSIQLLNQELRHSRWWQEVKDKMLDFDPLIDEKLLR
ncbi:hypothetical protein CP533_5224 [Ophiocordyceps camponoti-saundersi (nom. inval.)]|nr:hypothetical protein CP533_5224 [Ophiocordyceps camponoti-saundersi (nom. inval.)]